MKYKQGDILVSFDKTTKVELLSDENNYGRATIKVIEAGWLDGVKEEDKVHYFQVSQGALKLYKRSN